MFGFLRPGHRDADYRRAYARLCGFQHRDFGIDTLPALSYEAVFLYLLAVDSGLVPRPDESSPTCCRLQRRHTRGGDRDAEVARFCCSLGVLLLSIKLDDDVRDDNHPLARACRWWLGGRIERAERLLSRYDPRLRQRVREVIRRHLELERERRQLALEDYVAPTADAFAYVFGLLGQLFPQRPQTSLLHEAGWQVGAAIIAFDCAVDWRRDRQLGRFNPLRGTADVADALALCRCYLSRLGWICREEFGAGCRTAAVVRATFERVPASLPARRSTPVALRTATRQAGRLFAVRAGFCDCDCPCGDCGDCGGGGDDVHAGALDCCLYPCYECAACGCERPDRKVSKKAGKQPETTAMVGMTGRAESSLNPTGFVAIGGKLIPAKSEGEWIDQGTLVVVIREDSFGVVVRAAKDR